MTNPAYGLKHLSDEELLLAIKAFTARECEATAHLIASLAELDARRLYLGEGYSSLFTYCTQCLHLSEHAAYGRIEAARAARRWPTILELLSDGAITLTTVSLLASHLTDENHRTLLDAAKHKSKREVEQQVAALRPLAPVPSSVRKLPSRQPSGTSDDVSSSICSLLQPPAVASQVFRLRFRRAPLPWHDNPLRPVATSQFTVTARRTTSCAGAGSMRHSVPDGDRQRSSTGR